MAKLKNWLAIGKRGRFSFLLFFVRHGAERGMFNVQGSKFKTSRSVTSWPVNQSTSEPVGQSISQPVSQSASEPVNQ